MAVREFLMEPYLFFLLFSCLHRTAAGIPIRILLTISKFTYANDNQEPLLYTAYLFFFCGGGGGGGGGCGNISFPQWSV